MNGIKSFLKQNLQVVLFVLCGLLTVLGILTFVLFAGQSEGVLAVLLVLLGIVLIAAAITLALLAFVTGSAERANFFLYDSKIKANRSVDELHFDLINQKMTFVMSKLTSTASKVWTQNVFEEESEVFAEGDDRFVPLVAYKIIYDLSERASESVWNLYLMADRSIIDAIAAALELNNDGELANAFRYLHENAAGSYERTEKFLADNKKYIQTKMVKYVKSNIDRF
ncbi:MAG: hypothetical protein IKJ24_01480 [Clostridia bacterium]|nr:hypothetical protein [Clostridia bacterium]